VNNANYQHYLEHTRHQFLVSRGISFSDLHDQGLDLVVTRVVIDYKFPLRSRDRFYVTLNVRREGNVRLIFDQEIFRSSDNKQIVKAEVTGIASRKGRPVSPEPVIKMLDPEG
jgi:acyl-CoA thioester hydrolase